MPTSTPPDSAPLAGVRVLDLTRLLPGPMCTLHLADMGADVIKIEDTGAGDYAAPALRGLVHRNKRGLRIDLKQPGGVAVLKALARSADVLVESFRPGVMDRLGVGYEALSAIRPELVYCSITGFGQTGPYRAEPGHDINYLALAGAADQMGRAGEPPAMSGIPVADLMGGTLTAAMGLLAALFDAQRSGRGRHVDISIVDSMLAHGVLPMMGVVAHGRAPLAGSSKLTGALPCYGLYRTSDGRHLAVGALERKFWDRFCELLGREDFKPLHQAPDAASTQSLRTQLAEIIGAQPHAWWQQRLRDSGCCVTPVLRLEEALDDEHFRARGMVVQPAAGPRQLGCPVKMSRFRFEVRRPAPAPGEHCDEILAEIGYSAVERAALQESGAAC